MATKRGENGLACQERNERKASRGTMGTVDEGKRIAVLPFDGVGRRAWGATTGTTASFKSFSHEKSVMKKTIDPKWDEGRYAQLDEMSRAASKL